MNRISIVTPTFNRVNELKRNIEALLKQTVAVYEHVIVDNNSSDGSEELIREYVENAPYKVQYIRETDSGIYNAMNKGIMAASGEWIHILNSDDYLLHSNVVEELSEVLAEHLDIILAPITQIGSSGSEKVWKPELKEWRIPHPGMLVQKKYYEKVGLYFENYRIVSDAIWKFQNIPNAKFHIMADSIVAMTLGGVSSCESKELYKENLKCIWFYQPVSFFRKIALLLKYWKKYSKTPRN